MPYRLKWAGVAMAGLMAVSGCAGNGDRDAAEPQGRHPAAARPVNLDFTVATLGGAAFAGKSLAGKPAVLWFWAPWCPTCVAQADHVDETAVRYAGRVNVIGVAGLGDVAEMRRFVKLTGINAFPQLADAEGVVWRRLGVTAQSSYVLLDAAGAVVHRGYLDNDQLDNKLADLITDP